jgi:RecA-family ATPase
MPEIPSWVIAKTRLRVVGGSNGHDSGSPTPKIETAADLDHEVFPPLEWFVAGMLPAGLALLAGPPKLGKSYVAVDIGLACARGMPAFRQVTTMQCDVLYIALEETKRRLQFRTRMILAGAPAPSNFHYSLTWSEGMACVEAIDSYLETNPDCRLVIVDCLGKVRGNPDGRKNAYQQDYADLGAFHALANRRGILLLLIHHTRKQDSSDPFDKINGTTAIMGAADTVLMLSGKRGEYTATLSIAGRDIENPSDFALSREPGTYVWTILGEAQAVQQETVQDRIYNYLREQQEPVTATELIAELKTNKWTTLSALGRLKKRGVVEQAGRGKWGARGQ